MEVIIYKTKIEYEYLELSKVSSYYNENLIIILNLNNIEADNMIKNH